MSEIDVLALWICGYLFVGPVVTRLLYLGAKVLLAPDKEYVSGSESDGSFLIGWLLWPGWLAVFIALILLVAVAWVQDRTTRKGHPTTF